MIETRLRNRKSWQINKVIVPADLAGHRRRRRRPMDRTGGTFVEILVGLSLMLAVITMTTSLCFRIQQVWKGITYQRLAGNELSNQLEWLTRLEFEKAKEQIKTLQISEETARLLTQAELSGEMMEDELGLRVTLRLSWEGTVGKQAAELSGWLLEGASAEAVEQTDQSSETGENQTSTPLVESEKLVDEERDP